MLKFHFASIILVHSTPFIILWEKGRIRSRIRIHTSDYWIRIREAQKHADPDPQPDFYFQRDSECLPAAGRHGWRPYCEQDWRSRTRQAHKGEIQSFKSLTVLLALHSIADSHHFVADPDPACHFDPYPGPACHFATDPDPTFHFDADLDPDPTLQKKVQSAQLVSLSYSLYFGFHQKIDADLDPDYKLIRIRLITFFGSRSRSYLSIWCGSMWIRICNTGLTLINFTRGDISWKE